MANNVVSEKKKALVARKDKLLQDIHYYEKRIADFHANKSATSFYEDNCSSDSDSEFPIIDNGPSVTQLKLQQSRLKTSLQATQELTNLHLLEHEVNIMVTDPVIVNEPQVTEPGVWKEVIAECRLDLVPFSITFHVHRPSVKFGAPSYRNLKVILSKPAHETELVNSVLTHVTTPSDAVEVLRSYASAHRSRRTTLACLAEKYPNLLFMEPLTEGGYILKCAGLLEVCWTLQNKWSPIAPFHHRMRFDLEYMDESYIKIITQYHRQLSDPSLETDERTALLSKIINTCLEAKGPTQELYESMESDDPENAQTLRQRRMTLDQEVAETSPKRKRDDAIMAPPKSLPKKSKAKGKENMVKSNERQVSHVSSEDINVTNASGKHSVVSGKSKDNRNVKATKENDSRKENAKLTKEVPDTNETAEEKIVRKKDQKSAKEKDVRKESVIKTKSTTNVNENAKSNKVVTNSGKENAISTKGTDSRKDQNSPKEKDTAVRSKENTKENTEVRNSVAKPSKEMSSKKDGVGKSKENAIDRENTEVRSSVATSDGTKNQGNVKRGNNLIESNVRMIKTVDEDGNSKDTNIASAKATKKMNINKNIEDGKENSAKVSKKNIVPKRKDNLNEGKDKNAQKDKGEIIETNNDKVNSDKESITKAKVTNTKNAEANKLIANTEKSVPKKVKKSDDIANIPAKKAKIDQSTKKNTDNNVKTAEKPAKSVNNIIKPANNLQKNFNLNPKNPIHEVKNIGQNTKKSLNNVQDKIKTVKNNVENNKNLNNAKLSQKFKVSTGNTKLGIVKKLSAGNTVKETSTESKGSKIPQSLTKVASSMKKNPLRISPRKLSSNLKGTANVKKTIQKPITSIPRLLKKPAVKT